MVLRRLCGVFCACAIIFLAGCATPTPPVKPGTPTPANTPTAGEATAEVSPDAPTRTSTPPEAMSALELLHYPVGMANKGACPGAKDQDGPQIVLIPPEPDSLIRKVYDICLMGYPLNERVEISLIDPSGSVVKESAYRVTETALALPGSPQRTVLRIPFVPDLSYPRGEWTIRARSNSADLRETFRVGACPAQQDGEKWPYLVTVRSLAYPAVDMLDPAALEPLRVGERIEARGACYPPDTLIDLQIYRSRGDASFRFDLVWSSWVTTGADGTFSGDATLTARMLDDGAGGYYVILPVTVEMHEGLRGAETSIASLPFAGFELLPTAAREACYRQAHYRLGDHLAVAEDALGVYRRSELLDSGRITRLPVGRRVELSGGPHCSEGRVSYLVHDPMSGVVGWVDQEGLQP